MLRYVHFKHRIADSQLSSLRWLAFLVGAGTACFNTMFPIILLHRLGNMSVVSLYISLLATISLASCLLSTWIFNRAPKAVVFKATLGIAVIAVTLMTLAAHLWQLVSLDIPRAACLMIVTIAMQLFLADFSTHEELPINESRFYTASNFGWLIGPLLGGFGIVYIGYESVFIITSILYAIAWLIFAHLHLVVKHPLLFRHRKPESLQQLFGHLIAFFQRPECVRVFFVKLGLFLWWILFLCYVPLSMKEVGYREDSVGWVITAGTLILLLLERYVGRLAAKNGVKPFLIAGYGILAACGIGMFLGQDYMAVLIPLFILCNVGAALIEPLVEPYFFRAVPKKDHVKFFGLYNTANPLTSILAPLAISGFFALGGSFGLLWLLGGLCFLALSLTCLAIRIR